MDLAVNLRREGDVVVLVASGEVDAYSAPLLRDAISKILAAGHHHIACDLADVGFLDSTGLGVLVGRLKAVRMLEGDMRLVITNDRVLRNFKITGLENIFGIDATVDESVAALQKMMK